MSLVRPAIRKKNHIEIPCNECLRADLILANKFNENFKVNPVHLVIKIYEICTKW